MSLLRRWFVVWKPERIASCVRKAPLRLFTASTWKPKGIELTDSDEEWVQFFNREDIDHWELSRGLKELYGMDLVPDPKIVVAMIRAARRLNDVALAIRVLEVVKEKACGNQMVYSYVMDEVNPLLDELGLKTLEELGLD